MLGNNYMLFDFYNTLTTRTPKQILVPTRDSSVYRYVSSRFVFTHEFYPEPKISEYSYVRLCRNAIKPTSPCIYNRVLIDRRPKQFLPPKGFVPSSGKFSPGNGLVVDPAMPHTSWSLAPKQNCVLNLLSSNHYYYSFRNIAMAIGRGYWELKNLLVNFYRSTLSGVTVNSYSFGY